MAQTCRNLTIAAVAALAVPAAGALAAPVTASAATESLLYVQTTDSGKLTHVRGTRRFRLVFDGVGAGVARFADRPYREAGQEKVGRFVEQWQSRGFGDRPPTAALVLDDAPSTRDVILLTLRKPRYLPRRAKLSYEVSPLAGATSRALTRFDARRDEARSIRFEHASLFVDDGAAYRYLELQLLFSNIAPQAAVSLVLDPSSGVSFTTGPPQSDVPGIGVDSLVGSPLPLSHYSVGAQRLDITTAAAAPGFSTVSARVALSLPENGPSSVRTTIVAPPDVSVQAGIGAGKLNPLPIGEGTLTLG